MPKKLPSLEEQLELFGDETKFEKLERLMLGEDTMEIENQTIEDEDIISPEEHITDLMKQDSPLVYQFGNMIFKFTSVVDTSAALELSKTILSTMMEGFQSELKTINKKIKNFQEDSLSYAQYKGIRAQLMVNCDEISSLYDVLNRRQMKILGEKLH